jgi:phage protein D
MVNFQQTWEGYMLAMLDAQSQIDTSVRKTVVGQGELDAQRYGSILRARGVVGVRGMGYSYDGYYYVQKVTHSISRGKYKQSFTLNREGIGSTANSLGG